MRELLYLSERKLAQFREDGSPRRRRWGRRVSELGATAPLGLGELQFALTDAPQGHPNLERVLRHLKSLAPKPAEYSQGSPDAGQWVKFKTRMNYQIVRPTTQVLDDNGEQHFRESPNFRESPIGPAAVVFWEPHSQLEPWSSSKPRLVLHGSPEHLLGLAAAPSESTDLCAPPSLGLGFLRLLQGYGGQSSVDSGLERALGSLLHQLDGRFPTHAAGLFTGYARVTFRFEVSIPPGRRAETVRTVVASPLYVEHATA
ncbi:SAVMC3_10250 family protein [Streptomyces sp. NPDC050273]|uniref:SAVMC3_10250 family protein n=1 Tax=Streptomyces sp. NPDC050273 TaxID=3154933 RepID=UPI0034335A35